MFYTPHQILSCDSIKKNKMDGACITMVERRGAYRGLVGKTKGKRPRGRSCRGW